MCQKRKLASTVVEAVTQLKRTMSADVVGDDATTVTHGGVSLSVECTELQPGMQLGRRAEVTDGRSMTFELPMVTDEITPLDSVVVQVRVGRKAENRVVV